MSEIEKLLKSEFDRIRSLIKHFSKFDESVLDLMKKVDELEQDVLSTQIGGMKLKLVLNDGCTVECLKNMFMVIEAPLVSLGAELEESGTVTDELKRKIREKLERFLEKVDVILEATVLYEIVKFDDWEP